MFLHSLDNIPSDSKICIYGAGCCGVYLKRFLAFYRPDIEVVFFIDSFKHGRAEGINIINPEEIDKLNDKFSLIVIASAFGVEIYNKLHSLNIQNYKILDFALQEYIYYYFYMILNAQALTEKEFEDYKPYYEKVKAIFNYEEDRILYDLLIKTRIYPENQQFLQEYTVKNFRKMSLQYFEFINKDHIKTIIEGGIYNAFSTYKFMTCMKNIQAIYGFEPFYEAYLGCQLFSEIDKSPKVKIYPQALYSHKTKINFFNLGPGSRITQEDNNENIKVVEAISIYEFALENDIKQIDYIKLDVEGAEMAVLKGANNILINHRPQLAISIYHKNEDLFEIPLYLNDLLSDYEFRLGHYTADLRETIIYGIPKELY